MPTERPNGHHKLTDRQTRFVDAYATPGTTITDAAREAGYKDPSNQGSRLLDQPKIQRALLRSLKQRGITYRKLGQRLSEALDAETVKQVTGEGRTTVRIAVPDHPTRLEAVKTGYKLYGHLQPSTDKSGEAPVIIHIVQYTAPSA